MPREEVVYAFNEGICVLNAEETFISKGPGMTSTPSLDKRCYLCSTHRVRQTAWVAGEYGGGKRQYFLK